MEKEQVDPWAGKMITSQIWKTGELEEQSWTLERIATGFPAWWFPNGGVMGGVISFFPVFWQLDCCCCCCLHGVCCCCFIEVIKAQSPILQCKSQASSTKQTYEPILRCLYHNFFTLDICSKVNFYINLPILPTKYHMTSQSSLS